MEASVIGTQEVTVPVTFGVLTTVVTFLPLLFFKGRWGNFAGQIPPIVAPVLLFSLIESKLILPAHLKRLRTSRTNVNVFARFQEKIADGLELFIERIYQPSLVFAIRHRYGVIASFIAMGLLMTGYCLGGRLGFVSLPTVDQLEISAYLEMPHDAKFENTSAMVERIVDATEQLKNEFTDTGLSRARSP